MPITRRTFLTLTSATLTSATLVTRSLVSQTTRPNVAAIDHDRILTAVKESPDLPTLAAATLVDPDRAAAYLQQATPLLASLTLPTTLATPESVLDTTSLAELAVALPHLHLTALPIFATYLQLLTEDRNALLARDRKDHVASSWLLQCAALARLTANEPILADLRHRFKTSTIRAQIDANGLFPHELTSPAPYRNSLFNLDLLAGAAVLLSTRFDSLWDHELQDGPGLRVAVARLVPYVEHRNSWPYPSDPDHFHDLPCRRPALLFAARAYSRLEYAELWRTLTPAQPTDPTLLAAFPIRQPILWTTQPRPS